MAFAANALYHALLTLGCIRRYALFDALFTLGAIRRYKLAAVSVRKRNGETIAGKSSGADQMTRRYLI